MKSFDTRAIELPVGFELAFAYISNAANLPEWTNAFESVSNGEAVLRTASSAAKIELTVRASLEQGTIDWVMQFEDGSNATAYSRLVRLDDDRSIYIFLLTPPPLPLDQLEGALDQQSEILKEELGRLRHILKQRA
jgi:hypothetical protein